MNLPKLKGVALGAGYFAPFQYEAWTRIPEVQITALYNRTAEKARSVMEKYGVLRYYADWREMIDKEKPDFVDIITPPETHQEICDYSAARGVHIICQKPLAPTLTESERIVNVAKSAGVRFMVHENFRWQPWYRAIRDIREAGTIGDFTHIQFMMRMGDGWGPDAYVARQLFFRTYPRLLLYETGVHFIDTFRFLLGEVESVFAHVRRLNPAILGEDAGQVFMKFRNGATAVWDANRYNEVEARTPRFTFGTLRIDGTKGHLTMDTESNIRLKLLGQPGFDHQYSREDKNFAGDCVYLLQRHFTDCMLTGAEFESTGSDYLKTIRVMEGAYESAKTAQTVFVE